MPPDGAFKTHTSLRETLNQADLDLPYFRTTEQNSPGLMQFANHKTAISPFAGELIAQQTSIWRITYSIEKRLTAADSPTESFLSAFSFLLFQ